MIFKPFAMQAFIALTILASSLTSSVNADIAPGRQFLFLGLVVVYELLTSDLAFARDGHEPTAVTAPTAAKRFRKLLFLGRCDSQYKKDVANVQSSGFPPGLQ